MRERIVSPPRPSSPASAPSAPYGAPAPRSPDASNTKKLSKTVICSKRTRVQAIIQQLTRRSMPARRHRMAVQALPCMLVVDWATTGITLCKAFYRALRALSGIDRLAISCFPGLDLQASFGLRPRFFSGRRVTGTSASDTSESARVVLTVRPNPIFCARIERRAA